MAYDPYKILGVSPDISEDGLTRAYRSLARRYHPDLNPGDANAANRMSEINAAYEYIKSGAANESDTTPDGDMSDKARMSAVKTFIRTGYYEQALRLLAEAPYKTAEWYCYSAISLSAIGDWPLAQEHALTAVDMDPDNPEYEDVLVQIESTAGRHLKKKSRRTMSNAGVTMAFLLVIIGFILIGFLSKHLSGCSMQSLSSCFNDMFN